MTLLGASGSAIHVFTPFYWRQPNVNAMIVYVATCNYHICAFRFLQPFADWLVLITAVCLSSRLKRTVRSVIFLWQVSASCRNLHRHKCLFLRARQPPWRFCLPVFIKRCLIPVKENVIPIQRVCLHERMYQRNGCETYELYKNKDTILLLVSSCYTRTGNRCQLIRSLVLCRSLWDVYAALLPLALGWTINGASNHRGRILSNIKSRNLRPNFLFVRIYVYIYTVYVWCEMKQQMKSH